ncbi:hypothetical protein PR048_000708 [Dryococelus australis]|uniref:Uncharacterized protein n=1 Tax=Dryococelus australis TaxID=614101 RepID=A0ABQ9IFE3_9NEOP|nr:hypothetical protein PR048_000708 [Dryococelus australis]
MKVTDDLVTTPKILVHTKDNTLLTLIDTGCSKSCRNKFLVIESLQIDAIIGCDFIKKHRLIPDLYDKVATVRHTHDEIIAVSFFNL